MYVETGSGDPDEGIYPFSFDSTSGELRQLQGPTSLLNPTFLAFAPDGQHLYSVRETTDSARVHAFETSPSSGQLRPLNAVPAEGGAPCYISVDATVQWVLTANYVGGNVAVFPVRDDGGLGPATQVVQHEGTGADPERQQRSHAHYFRMGPQNRYALAANLGIDEVRIYPFDAEQGRLDTADVRIVSTPPGTGPRHLSFHPSGETVYLIGELSGTITVYDYDAERGRMSAKQTVSTTPDEFDGAARSADLHVHPSGDFLYASNRGDANDVVVYRIEEKTGRLERIGRQREHIQWPRTFTISPDGTHLLVANRRADAISVFDVDTNTGQLTYTGHSVDVPAPTKIIFSPLDQGVIPPAGRGVGESTGPEQAPQLPRLPGPFGCDEHAHVEGLSGRGDRRELTDTGLLVGPHDEELLVGPAGAQLAHEARLRHRRAGHVVVAVFCERHGNRLLRHGRRAVHLGQVYLNPHLRDEARGEQEENQEQQDDVRHAREAEGCHRLAGRGEIERHGGAGGWSTRGAAQAQVYDGSSSDRSGETGSCRRSMKSVAERSMSFDRRRMRPMR